MSATAVSEKIKQLPEPYIEMVDTYVEQLLEKTRKIENLKGSLFQYADENLSELEQHAFSKAMEEKHANSN